MSGNGKGAVTRRVKAVHAEWPFPVGMMLGLAISVGFIIYRYGRQGSLEQAHDGHGRVKGNDR